MFFKLALLAVIGIAYGCHVHHIPIKEGRNRFQQIMITDAEAGTLELITPAHGNRDASTRKEFKNEGYYANKVFARRAGDRDLCFYGKLEDDSTESVEVDEDDAEKAGYKLPKEEKVENRAELVIPSSTDEIPEVVAEYCKGMAISARSKNEAGKGMKAVKKDALAIALAAKHDARKRAIVREFIACTNASTMKIMTCPGDKLRASCKIRRPHCTYKISCPMESQGFNCKGLHKLNSIVCCDYDC